MMSKVVRLGVLCLAIALAACSSNNEPSKLRPFDAGINSGATDADELDNGVADPDSGAPAEDTGVPAADAADPADASSPDAPASPDAEPAEAGVADAEPAEVGYPDAERAEVPYIDAEIVDSGEPLEAGIDGGLDAGTTYDATVCTGQIGGQDPCTMCAESNCCNELIGCANSFTCSAEFNQCLAPCTLSAPVSQCMAQCFVSTEGQNLRTCVTNQCGNVCP